MILEDYARLLLRLGLAFSFAYAAIAGFLEPLNWIGYFPTWMRLYAPVSDGVLLGVFGALELVLAVSFLSQKRPFYISIAGGILLLGITVLNFGSLDIVFRDVGLGLAAFALAFLSKPTARREDSTKQESLSPTN